MLDHTLFPHVFDSIVEQSPPESLLALRAASIRMRNRADHLLFKHIEVVFRTVKMDDDDDEAKFPDSTIDVAVKPFGCHLRFEWRRYPFHSDQLDGTVPAADMDARVDLREYVHERVMSACILDIPWHALQSAPDWTLEQMFDRPIYSEPWCGVTVRILGEPHTNTTNLGHGIFILGDFGTHILFGDVHDDGMGLSYKRFVRVLNCPPGYIAECAEIMVSPDTWDSIVADSRDLIFHLLRTDDSAPPQCTGGLTIVEHIIITAIDPYIRITVVGGAEEFRLAAGLPRDASQDELYTALAPLVIALSIHSDWRYTVKLQKREVLRWLPERLRFVTPHEYESEVGSHQFALETKRDPYTGPPATFIE